jgi:DNA-binding response OmpR family regulator
MVDRERHRVTVNEKLLDLTPSEFGLLESLVRQPGRVFSRSELIDSALGGDSLVLERTIDVHVRSLRTSSLEHRLRYCLWHATFNLTTHTAGQLLFKHPAARYFGRRAGFL